MMKSIGMAVTVGSLLIALNAPASAQAVRIDPALKVGASPLLTDVQFQPGGPVIRRPGGAPGGRPGGGAPGVGRPGGGAGANYGNRRFGGGYGHRNNGFGVGAGIAGLAAGAVIGGAIASQGAPGYGYGYDNGYQPAPAYGYGYGYDGNGAYAPPPPPPPPQEDYAQSDPAPVQGGGEEAYCEQRYRSYDPSSGTYLGFDGERHPCP